MHQTTDETEKVTRILQLIIMNSKKKICCHIICDGATPWNCLKSFVD